MAFAVLPTVSFFFAMESCRQSLRIWPPTWYGTRPANLFQAEKSPLPMRFPMSDQWPFRDAQNLAVISVTRITKGAKPILYVVHDEDGDWQFLDGDDVSEEDA